MRPGQTLAFDLIGTDAEGDPIEFTLASGPDFAPGARWAPTLVPLGPGRHRAPAPASRGPWIAGPLPTRRGRRRTLLFTATSTTPCRR
ncbi:MAG: hypothetical protein WKG07_04580 [Hymenobacter sp.]